MGGFILSRREIVCYFRKSPLARHANADPPVNFAHPPSGEDGDSQAEFLASNANPRVCVGPRRCVFQKETAGETSICKMFEIFGVPEGARVKLSARLGSTYRTVAPRHGFEPRFTAPKAAVLPLDDRGKYRRESTF